MGTTIGVLGAGAWGTALAIQAARAGHKVVLWGRKPEAMAAMRSARENRVYLPGYRLPGTLTVTSDTTALLSSCAILCVCPAQHLRGTLTSLAHHWPGTVPAVVCCKGIERGTGLLMTDVAAEILPHRPLAVLSGPSFAGEVAAGLPTAVVIGAGRPDLAGQVAARLATPSFRPYLSDDVIGIEVAGAVKNVLAIASGITEGRTLGFNARAALITRGLAEIARLAQTLGGRAETQRGLAGIGDVALSCTATLSRNYSFGVELGKGRAAAEILAGRHVVTEGVHTAASVTDLARRKRIEMPICAAVHAVVNSGAEIGRVLNDLLSRPIGRE